LSHGNIDESSLLDRHTILSTNSLDFWSGIDSWEEHEEYGGLRVHFSISSEDIEWSLFNESFT